MKIIVNDFTEVIEHKDVILNLLCNQTVTDKGTSFTYYKINLHNLLTSFTELAKKYINIGDYHRLAELGHVFWFIFNNIEDGEEIVIEY